MTASGPTTPVPPYAAMLDIASSGRVFLAKAMTHYCLVHWGMNEMDVAAALDREDRRGTFSDEAVRTAANVLGRAFADGLARTFARPFHGGLPVALPREAWELDDHEARFRDCALNLKALYDPAAEPTHWIFVDAEEWDRLVEMSCGGRPGGRIVERARASARDAERVPVASDDRDFGDLLGIAEVMSRTKLGRSTVYAKIGRGEFPAQVDPGARIATWREAEVDEWLASRPERHARR